MKITILKYVGAACGAVLVGIALMLTATKVVYPAISSLVGLAVSESAILWNNVRDASAGDNLVNGILMTSLGLFDGTNFDRARGDIANGLDVDVTRISGTVTVVGNQTPTDAYTNPTTAVTTYALNGTSNGTTWDKLKDIGVAGDVSTTGAGISTAGCMYYARAAAVYQRCGGSAGYLSVLSQGNQQSTSGTVTTQSVSAANTAVTINVTGAANVRSMINGIDAYCSAGTSGITITTSTGPTTVWTTPAAGVGTTLFSKEFPVALTSPTLADTLAVTLAACGVGNTGTLMVRGGRGV